MAAAEKRHVAAAAKAFRESLERIKRFGLQPVVCVQKLEEAIEEPRASWSFLIIVKQSVPEASSDCRCYDFEDPPRIGSTCFDSAIQRNSEPLSSNKATHCTEEVVADYNLSLQL